MFGPITDAERRGWQLRTARLLDSLLTRPDLPLLSWTVGEVGATLVGRALCADNRRRATWTTWVKALGAQPRPERVTDGITHVSAVAKDYDGLVNVVLLADVFDDHPIGRGGASACRS